MKKTPFSRITHSSRRQHWLFLTLLPMVVTLAAGMYWGIHRIIAQEQRRFALDFSTLVGYADAQEKFLRQLKAQNENTSSLSHHRTARIYELETPKSWDGHLFQGQETVVDMPFSLACGKDEKCHNPPSNLVSLASYLSDFYSSFWASSYFPAAAVFFVNENDEISISVPAINFEAGYEPLDLHTYKTTIDIVRKKIKSIDSCSLSSTRETLTWFRSVTLPDYIIGMIPTDIPANAWHSNSLKSTCIYAATLLSKARINNIDKNLYKVASKSFGLRYPYKSWLIHREHGLLVGETPYPHVEQQGIHYTLSGIVLKLTDENGVWTSLYQVNYTCFFQNNLWLPFGTILLFLLSILGSISYMRWFNRSVIKPAQDAQREILERDAFSQTLINTAPVALCLIERTKNKMVFANVLAQEWLDAKVGEPLPISSAITTLLSKIIMAKQNGVIERLDISNNRTLYVAYAPTRYMQQDVTLCAFTDVSAHTEIQENLIQAKKAADEANEAKSTFLATMSHEIRTPLYGALGTIELLSLTRLDNQQRQYVNRIEDASKILLQIISDILDISKIEANQLQLTDTLFDFHELIQSCTGAYAATAYKKGLLLFSVIEIGVPEYIQGDEIRTRQILSNLISNAIKFTEKGNVIVRASLQKLAAENFNILLEVEDSGIGISKSQQKKLFSPFYMVEYKEMSNSGTGLGLSICSRLAKLMNSRIQVESTIGVGSKFYLLLSPKKSIINKKIKPVLNGINVLVKTPHPEYTANICSWLEFWGALITSKENDETNFLLSISSTPQPNNEWSGQHLTLSLSGNSTQDSEIDTYNLSSIGFGIEHLLHGKMQKKQNTSNHPKFDLRILVAEDNPINQVTIQGQLEQLGCKVTIAEDGEEALAFWDMIPHDIILTDVNMPYMNGYELSRKLRSEGVTNPIVGVTANAMSDEERRCMESGMDAWLVKPIGLSQLVSLLNRFTSTDSIKAPIGVDAHSYFEPSDISVLEKHRQLFLQCMQIDLNKQHQGILEKNSEAVAMAIHRMRGALVLAKQRKLAEKMEKIEQQIDILGLNDDNIANVNAVAEELHRLLIKIETEK